MSQQENTKDFSFVELWAKVEAQPTEPPFTEYTDKQGAAIYRQRITAAHVRQANEFTFQIAQLFEDIKRPFTKTDQNTAWSIGLASCLLYREVEKTKAHNEETITYKVKERIVKEPIAFYNLQPEFFYKIVTQFLGMANACGYNEAWQNMRNLGELVRAAMPPTPKNEGDNKKKSPSKKKP